MERKSSQRRCEVLVPLGNVVITEYSDHAVLYSALSWCLLQMCVCNATGTQELQSCVTSSLHFPINWTANLHFYQFCKLMQMISIASSSASARVTGLNTAVFTDPEELYTNPSSTEQPDKTAASNSAFRLVRKCRFLFSNSGSDCSERFRLTC